MPVHIYICIFQIQLLHDVLYSFYYLQAHGNIGMLRFDNGWGKKHQLFVKWKYAEAKVC